MNEKNISYEEAIEKIEGALRSLESGNLGLDDSMMTYEEALKLLHFCHSALESAERRVNLLLEQSDGSVAEAPFAVTDEA